MWETMRTPNLSKSKSSMNDNDNDNDNDNIFYLTISNNAHKRYTIF